MTSEEQASLIDSEESRDLIYSDADSKTRSETGEDQSKIEKPEYSSRQDHLGSFASPAASLEVSIPKRGSNPSGVYHSITHETLDLG